MAAITNSHTLSHLSPCRSIRVAAAADLLSRDPRSRRAADGRQRRWASGPTAALGLASPTDVPARARLAREPSSLTARVPCGPVSPPTAGSRRAAGGGLPPWCLSPAAISSATVSADVACVGAPQKQREKTLFFIKKKPPPRKHAATKTRQEHQDSTTPLLGALVCIVAPSFSSMQQLPPPTLPSLPPHSLSSLSSQPPRTLTLTVTAMWKTTTTAAPTAVNCLTCFHRRDWASVTPIVWRSAADSVAQERLRRQPAPTGTALGQSRDASTSGCLPTCRASTGQTPSAMTAPESIEEVCLMSHATHSINRLTHELVHTGAGAPVSFPALILFSTAGDIK